MKIAELDRGTDQLPPPGFELGVEPLGGDTDPSLWTSSSAIFMAR